MVEKIRILTPLFVLSLSISLLFVEGCGKNGGAALPDQKGGGPETGEGERWKDQEWKGRKIMEKGWKEIDRLADEQKFEEACRKAENLLKRAKAERMEEEWTRALIRVVQLKVGLHGYETAVRFLKGEGWPEGFISRTILNLFYAWTLVRYYEIYSWEVNQRERVESKGEVDLRAWTKDQIYEEVIRVYNEIWRNREILGKERVDLLDEFIEKNNYPPHIRGTLRDALSYLFVQVLGNTTLWRADHSNEVYRLKVSELLKAEPDRPQPALSDPEVHPLVKICIVLDDLERWHSGEAGREAALEARMERLRRLHTSFTGEGDRRLIKKDLEERLKRERDLEWWSAGMALLASFVRAGTEPESLIRAKEIAERGYRRYPGSTGGAQCLNIVRTLEAPDYNLRAISSDSPNRRSIEVSHKNLEKLYFRAYRQDLKKLIQGARDYYIFPQHDELEKMLRGKSPSHEWVVPLPATPDYRFHKTFVTPPMKEKGTYVIIASARGDFERSNNLLKSLNFIVSDLVIVTERMPAGGYRVNILSGDTGRPVPNAGVTLYRYDWKRRHRPVEHKRGDESGEVLFGDGKPGYNYFLLVEKDGDLNVDMSYLHFYSPSDGAERRGTLIYTDRSIYRPLQKVLWKVILYEGGEGKADFRTKPGAEVTVIMRDANGEEVERKRVFTNDFGSASGEFLIPAGRLLGNWQIAAEPAGSTSFMVEEYKRPTFEVKMEDPGEEMRINRPVTLKGESVYYFGLPVTSGEVKWRVTREPVYPWWWYHCLWFRSPSPPRGSQVVAAGTTGLDKEGRFSLTFTPEADERLAETSREVTFRYRVSVDVTGEGGETRSASKSFRLGFVGVEARIESEVNFFRTGEEKTFKIVRTNLTNAPAPGTGSWRVVELVQPDRTPLPADIPFYEPPSSKGGGKGGYLTEGDRQRPRFDHGYDPAITMRLWKDGRVRGKGKLKHNRKGEAEARLPDLPAGAYRLYYITVDRFGETYETSKEFIVAGERVSLALPSLLLSERSSVPVGQKARFLVHSGLPDQIMIFRIYQNGVIREERLLESGDSPSLIEIPVTERERGGFAVSLIALRDQQYMNFSRTLFVPWDDRELKLKFSSFRDRIRPGTRETFTVKVRGEEGVKSLVKSSEILAYMYDRSLDFFTPHLHPDPLSLLPSGTGLPMVHSNLRPASQGWLRCDGFTSPPPFPHLHGDSLIILESYGIGGPGMRGYYRMGAPLLMEGEMADTLARAVPAKMKAEMKRDEGVPPEADEAVSPEEPEGGEGEPAVEIRTKFEETAFWKPHLLLKGDGTAAIEFVVPDSVTSWNLYVHAVTKELKAGTIKKEAESIKDLMVRPYLPRFLREGDEAGIKVVVNNASGRDMKGKIDFDILDIETGKSILSEFNPGGGRTKGVDFTVPPGGGTNLTFPIKAPARVGSAAFRVTARSGDLSDGEERALPILPGRMHLVQSRFVALKGSDGREMTFPDLAGMKDPTLINDRLVVTLDAQLFYGVLEALPYLVNFPYECTEQILNRFISTGIISTLFRDYPAIAKMAEEFSKREAPLERWYAPDPNRKMALEETPWLEMARGGKDAGYGLINVLDPGIVKGERRRSFRKLEKAQTGIGGFPWFPGGPPSPYITLYILYGFSKGLEFGVEVPKEMVLKAWSYLHRHYMEELVKSMMADDCCWEFVTFLNYTLSNYPDSSWRGDTFTEKERKGMLDFSFRHWKAHSPYMKGYLSLTLKRMGRMNDALLVWGSVMDSAKTDEDTGTHWAPEERAWLWYNDTIETHAFAIRTLLELLPEDRRTSGLVQWIFLNKKLNHWKSTRTTAEVIYSLVKYLEKAGALAIREDARVIIGKRRFNFLFEPEKYTGRKNQIVIPGREIDPASMSTVRVEKGGKGMIFASATWHFSTERLPEEGGGDLFRISRRYFKRESTGKGFILKPLAGGTRIDIGDQVEVQVSITARHPAEYIHLRDPRPAGFEPEATTSGHKYDLGIYWYEEVRDSGQNFFFEHLPRGEYTFRYRIRANMAGRFKVSPATIQSMYAPEFNAYSSGAMVEVR